MGRPRFQLLRTVFRYAFHAAAALSALALVACLILWLPSYYRLDEATYVSPPQDYVVGTMPGRVWAAWRDGARATVPGFSWRTQEFPSGYASPWSYATWSTRVGTTETRVGPGRYVGYENRWDDYLGVSLFTCLPPPIPGVTGRITVKIPLSYLTLLSALLPVLWLRAWRRRAQRARGFPVEPPSPSEPRPSGSIAADSPPPAR